MMKYLLDRLPIGARIHLTTLAAVLGLLALAAVQTVSHIHQLEEDRVDVLRGVVETAASVAARYEGEERAGRLPRAEAQRLALEAIKAFRYRGQEYVWVNDLGPRMVMHPFRPDLDGQDVSQMKDLTGFRIFQAFADTVRRQGSGVVGYLWPRPGANQAQVAPVEKLSFVLGFEPWGWVLGSGIYVDDLRAEQRQVAWQSGGLALVAALVVA